LLAGCEVHRPQSIDPALIAVYSQASNLRTDRVGDGQWETTATFILVDAENRSRHDAYVTLGGELSDREGKTIARLRPESLFVPSGATRAFVLVDDQQQARPEATGGRVFVRGATAGAAPPIRIADPVVHPDGDRVIVAGNVVNDARRAGWAMVHGTFRSSTGLPMARMHSLFPIGAGVTRPARLVGPAGSKFAELSVGEVTFE
jgi:hypothetical protein